MSGSRLCGRAVVPSPWPPCPLRCVCHLRSTGLRCMMGWCGLPLARAYAFALYVNEEAVALGSLPAVVKAKTADPGACEVSLRLKMAREIDGPHISKGFSKSLAKMVAAVDPARLEGDELAQVADFVAMFSPKHFQAGGAVYHPPPLSSRSPWFPPYLPSIPRVCVRTVRDR